MSDVTQPGSTGCLHSGRTVATFYLSTGLAQLWITEAALDEEGQEIATSITQAGW